MGRPRHGPRLSVAIFVGIGVVEDVIVANNSVGIAGAGLVARVVAYSNSTGVRIGSGSIRDSQITQDTLGIDAIPGAGEAILLRGNTISQSTQGGVDVGPGVTVVLDGNAFLGNTPAVNLSSPSSAYADYLSGNSCDDGTCPSDGRRRFYLTRPPAVAGAVAPTACARGFHFASLWEIRDPSQLFYDRSLGRTGADTGHGAPQGPTGGWIRTGASTATTGSAAAGIANCNGYTSSLAADQGTSGVLDSAWNGAANQSNPWRASVVQCNTPSAVWCVED
jgi:hypothetical protein